jgi:hypothetical protein
MNPQFYKVILLCTFLSNSFVSLAQNTQAPTKDSTTLLNAFTKGKIYGQVRMFSIFTDNQNELLDFHATAIGLSLTYRSAIYKGFQWEIGGNLTQNIESSDFNIKDPITGAQSRYEIGLFDLTNINKKNILLRLQALSLKYYFKNGSVLVGNYVPKNLFINAQDGRMSPTMVEGIAFELNPNKKLQIKADWIWRISPRSTTRWYSVANSLGINSTGLNPDGSRSLYAGNTQSAGVGILDVNYQLMPSLKVLAGNIFVENIFNTAYLKTEFSQKVNNTQDLLVGAILVRQSPVGNGGNADPAKSYFPTQNRSLLFSSRLGYRLKSWDASLNFSRINAEGRFLMPREWGAEQIYTFISRERNEGLGDVWAYSTRLSRNWFNKKLRTEIAYGYYRLPDVKNVALNKYGNPSYSQLNMLVNHQFAGKWKGLNAQVLYVQKDKQGNVYNNERYVINRVNMSQFNLVMNYLF